jgi:chemotaxis protein MotB
MSDESPDEGGFEEPTAPAWMATFGDMMSLLLTFFVLLMSFASMDVRKFAAVAGSMRDAFGVQTTHAGLVESLSDSIVRLSDTESTPWIQVLDMPTRVAEREQKLLHRLTRAIEARELQRVVTAESSPRGVVLRMQGQLLFDAGSAELRPSALVFLGDVADLIRTVPGDISVEGHSDSLPVASQGDSGASNWDLSADRALATLRQLVTVGKIDESRLRATAFGSARPLTSNEDEAGRAQNRRVEFVFLRSEIELYAAGLTDSGSVNAIEVREEAGEESP